MLSLNELKSKLQYSIINLIVLFFSCIVINSIGAHSCFSILKDILPSNPIIVEAGIQFGQDTKKLATLWPQATIYGFEPHPLYFKKACNLLREFSNVTLFPFALSNSCGQQNFYLAGPGSSLLMPMVPGFFPKEHDEWISVQTTTLDAWANEHRISSLDFLWLALEGFELPVLQAGTTILESVRVLYLEVNLFNYWEGTTEYHTLKQWLHKKNFYELWKNIIDDLHGNVIFVR